MRSRVIVFWFLSQCLHLILSILAIYFGAVANQPMCLTWGIVNTIAWVVVWAMIIVFQLPSLKPYRLLAFTMFPVIVWLTFNFVELILWMQTKVAYGCTNNICIFEIWILIYLVGMFCILVVTAIVGICNLCCWDDYFSEYFDAIIEKE